MRILLAALVLTFVPGVVLAYLAFQASIPAPAPVVSIAEEAAGQFDVELTLTFDVASDEFDLSKRSLVVTLGADVLLESSEPVKAGKPVVIRDVQGVKAGSNTFIVKAGVAEEPAGAGAGAAGDPAGADDGFAIEGFSLDDNPPAAQPKPPGAEPDAARLYRAMRVRVLRDGAPVATETIWSEPGGAVQGVFDLVVPAEAAPSDSTHSHSAGAE